MGIINFEEPLPQETLKKAQKNAAKCDVMLALGSSLVVFPAAAIPRKVGWRWHVLEEKGTKPKVGYNLIIVNLQKTPLDNLCSLRIFAKIDDVMVPLMKELGMEIPEYKLNRYMRVQVKSIKNKPDLKKVSIAAVDVDGINATVFEEVKLSHNGNAIEKFQSKKARLTEERKEREARRALRDAQRAKLRMALKAKKMEQKKREQLANGNTEPISKQKKPIKKVRERGGKRYESGQEFQFHIESSMLESANNDDEQKENENGSNPSHGLVAELSFFGNFGEPQLLIPLQPFLDDATSSTNENGNDDTLEFMCRMVMDIPSKSWNVEPYSVPEIEQKEVKEETVNAPNPVSKPSMDEIVEPKKPEKPKKTKEEIEKEEREQREAQQQAYDELERRVKERKALRAKKLEEKKKEQLLNGNNEPVTEPAAESKDDDSNLLKPEKTKEQLEEEKAEREAQRKIRDAYITKQRFASKSNKTEEELLAAKKEREAQRALRDAQRSKERMAIKAMKRKQRKKEPSNDDSNLSNGNQPEDASAAPLVLNDVEAPNGVEFNPEDDTMISPVHRRPSDDKSPSPYQAHLSENDTVSASNDADLVSGDQ